MAVPVSSLTTLTFDQFWRWMKRHQNCILQAGTPEMSIFDQEDFVWRVEEEEDRTPVVLVMRGKALIGELLLDPKATHFVQVSPEPESDGHYLFEMVGGEAEPIAYFQFLFSHGVEEDLGGHKSRPFAQ